MSTSTADLYDGRGEALQSVAVQFQSFGGNAQFDGPIRTLECFEDNLLLRSMLSSPGAGAVLVVDGGGSLQCALLGDVIAQLAIDNGWAGVVINGAIRDRVALSRLPIGVKALGSNPRKSRKLGHGTADTPVRFADVTFLPGRMIYCDEDGILVSH